MDCVRHPAIRANDEQPETAVTTTWHSKSLGVYVLLLLLATIVVAQTQRIRRSNNFSHVAGTPRSGLAQRNSPAIVRRRFLLLKVHLLPKIMTWISHINNLRGFPTSLPLVPRQLLLFCHLIFARIVISALPCAAALFGTIKYETSTSVCVSHRLDYVQQLLSGENCWPLSNENKQTIRPHPLWAEREQRTFQSILIIWVVINNICSAVAMFSSIFSSQLLSNAKTARESQNYFRF